GEEADDARDAIAIALEPGPVEVARLAQIHLHAVDDLAQALGGDAERLAMRLERARHRMLRLAVEEIRHFAAPPGELRGGNLRIHAFVDDVVHLAAEGIERSDGAPALGREKEKRVVEARAARGGLLLAVLVWRCQAAPLIREHRGISVHEKKTWSVPD